MCNNYTAKLRRIFETAKFGVKFTPESVLSLKISGELAFFYRNTNATPVCIVDYSRSIFMVKKYNAQGILSHISFSVCPYFLIFANDSERSCVEVLNSYSVFKKCLSGIKL